MKTRSPMTGRSGLLEPAPQGMGAAQRLRTVSSQTRRTHNFKRNTVGNTKITVLVRNTNFQTLDMAKSDL